MGPDFKSPAPDYRNVALPPIQERTASANVAGGDPEALQVGGDVASRWWELYQSAELTTLVEQAVRDNPDLHAAHEALNRAKQLERAEGGRRLPSVNADISQQRSRYAQAEDGDTGAPSHYAISEARLGAIYDMDLWGGIRRSIEASGAQTDYARFELEASYLALTSHVATAAFEKSGLDERIRIQKHIIELQRQWLDLVEGQAKIGTRSDFDVALQQSTLAQSKSSLETLLVDREQVQHRLAALLGKPPAAVADVSIDLDTLKLPATLPVTLPSRLVEQRPDVRAAEAALHAQTAMVGVATAQRFPDITISARLGAASLDPSRLFGAGNGFWSVSTGASQSIFDAGSLKHRQRAQEAAMHEADARWRATVIDAFRALSDALSRLQHDAVKLQLAADDEAATRRIQTLLERRNAIGSVSTVQLIAAQEAYQTSSLGLAQARTDRFIDTVVLYEELGGGWWRRDDAGEQQAH
ncbi:efflux transporter outer membrane subunit [Xanthomonas campestris pv. phormiicola]|nr:efflux transporter outer membrane subunit [Xanthomonas campestris pv. phormiicola]